jgi:alkylhydroperoxidase/carboxymuconolactone decarboxylase family protein YurZ
MPLPEPYTDIKERHPDVMDAYEALGARAASAGPLSEREQRLVKLGMAIGAGLEGATHSHARRAVSDGMTPEEIRHAVLLAVTTLGLPSMVRGMTWVEDILED